MTTHRPVIQISGVLKEAAPTNELGLVAADIPDISAIYDTAGSAAAAQTASTKLAFALEFMGR